MQDNIEGVLKFQREAFPKRSGLFKELSTAQNPKALFIACSDSRVVPELLTSKNPATCSWSATPATSCRPTARSLAVSRRQ